MIKITTEPLDPEEITAQVRKDSNGAVITFLGTTRDFSEGRNVEYLEYEAYQPMAENTLQQIADELRDKWGIDDFAVAHRIGRVDIGEADEVIGVEILWASRGFTLAGLPQQRAIGEALNSLGSLASVS